MCVCVRDHVRSRVFPSVGRDQQMFTCAFSLNADREIIKRYRKLSMTVTKLVRK